MSQSWKQLASTIWSAQSEAFVVHSGVILDSSEACLIDPGLFAHEIEAMSAFLTTRHVSKATIILTHCHWDHVLGPEHLPKLETMAHAEYPRQAVGRQGRRVRKQVEDWESEQRIERTAPFAIPLPDVTFDESITLSVGKLRLQLIHAAGHAPDHLVVYEPNTGLLWAADMLSDLEIPYICHSLVAYQRTLQTLSHLDIQLLVPAHGYPATTPSDIAARFQSETAYIQELKDRIERAISQGKSCIETVADCASIPYRHRQSNDRPHRMNVESAYLELGGETDLPTMGWQGLVEGMD